MKAYIIILLSIVFGFGGGIISNQFDFSSNEDGSLMNSKIAYIRLPELQQQSEMFKRMQKSIETDFQSIQNNLDSVKKEIVNLENKLSEHPNSKVLNESYERRVRDYRVLEERLLKKHQDLVSESNAKFWSFVNEKVQNYGKKNGCVMVFGATGNGGIMYGDEAIDVTSEIADVINQ